MSWSLVTSLFAILVVAWISGRLLGVRQTVLRTLATGAVGWVVATFLSLVIADYDRDAAGFERNVWVLAVIFTMSATAFGELLAKPGTLARAQAGLASPPRPLRALRRRRERVVRYTQIVRVLARRGLGPLLGIHRGSQDGDTQMATAPVRLRLALQECGGVFVKLGQVLSTRADLLPPAFIEELSRLRESVAPEPADAVRSVLEAEFSGPLDATFAEFDWNPLAAASIGQIHRARLPTGEHVVVKVQRPNVRAMIERDIAVLTELARTVEARMPWAAELRVGELVADFVEHLREELDFRIEARNAAEAAETLADVPDVIVPAVFTELSSARVLVLEWLDGVSVGHGDGIELAGTDGGKLADTLLRTMLRQMLVDGLVHADPHPGNIMVLADGRLALLDYGAAARLDALLQASVRQMLLAVRQLDAALLRQAVLEVATPRGDFNDELFERALARFLARNLRAGAAPDAAMLNGLVQLFFSFRLSVPAELTTLFRAIVTLEGTLVTLSPGFQVIDAAQRIAGEWATELLTPASIGDAARKEVLSAWPLLRRLPRHADRVATLLERGDIALRVSLFAGPQDVVVISRLVNRVVLALLGGVVGVLSVMLLVSQAGPAFTSDTTLFQFFGYFGLFCATVLILRVIVAVAREGQE